MSPDPTPPTAPATPDGNVETREGRRVLRFERRLEHPIERVWAALTEPGELESWLAEADLDLAVGGRVELRWLNTDEDGNRAIATGTVTQLEPPRLLECETDIHGLMRWELREEGEGCHLTFFTAPADPAYTAMTLAGWHMHLDHLAEALAGRPVDWPEWSRAHRPRWDVYHQRYEARTR
jgi:uncharacterized protein YndB with AHSA1/START domain